MSQDSKKTTPFLTVQRTVGFPFPFGSVCQMRVTLFFGINVTGINRDDDPLSRTPGPGVGVTAQNPDPSKLPRPVCHSRFHKRTLLLRPTDTLSSLRLESGPHSVADGRGRGRGRGLGPYLEDPPTEPSTRSVAHSGPETTREAHEKEHWCRPKRTQGKTGFQRSITVKPLESRTTVLRLPSRDPPGDTGQVPTKRARENRRQTGVPDILFVVAECLGPSDRRDTESEE